MKFSASLSRMATNRSVDIPLGNLRVVLVNDTIEAAIGHHSLDAVVSSDDTFLSMSGGVSAAILNLAGRSIQLKARQLVPLQVGDVAVTPAGDLPVRYILHAVTTNAAHSIRPSERMIRQLVRRILTRCEALRIRHIAIPAFATGAAGLDAAVWAGNLVDVLLKHGSFTTVVETVVVPVPDPGLFDQVLSAIRTVIRWGSLSPIDEQAGAPDAVREPVPQTPMARAVAVGRPLSPPAPQASAEEAPTAEPSTGFLRRALAGLFQRPLKDDRTTDPHISPFPPASSDARSRAVLTQRYVLLEELGRGGFGVVHLAWDLVLRQVVAIKKLKDEYVHSKMLQREAAIAVGLNHAGIVRAHHFEPRVEQDGPYLVMEYLPWMTAEQWLADVGDSLLPARAVLDVGRQLCEALGYAHEHGILHLDIKPSNVFVDPSGERAKLSDFGVSKITSNDRRALQVAPVGTPAYMAPEQRQSGAKVGPATDLYQLAATLWDLLAGRPYRPRGPVPDVSVERERILRLLLPALSDNPSERPADAPSFGKLLVFAGAETET